MTKSRNTGSSFHLLGAELWFLFYLFQDKGHPVTKTVVICLIILTVILLIVYYDRPVKNFNRMLHGLEYREGTFKLRHGSRALGPDTQEYLNRLTIAFSQVIMERERQAHFFENILRINPSGILVISKDQKIRLYNESFARILSLKDPITYEQIELNYPDLARLINNFENGRQFIQKLMIQGVSTWISITGSRLMLEEEDYQVIALEDVQKVANKKELETWEEMAKIIIHEVKNSLSPIRLLLNQLVNWFRENSGRRSENRDQNHEIKLLSTLESIEKRTLGLMDFVEGYKSLLHLPQAQKSRLSLAVLIQELIHVMDTEAKQNGVCLSGSCADEIFIYADMQQLTQVLMNLIGNSMHFLEEVADSYVIVRALKKNSQIIISVEDNGPGIPLELQEQVFTPFFSTRPEGTGIGLSFARKVISQHQGDIRLMSEPGKTVFIIQLPSGIPE